MLPKDFLSRTGPISWIGSMPVYCATFLAGAQLAFMVLTALALGVSGKAALQPFFFSWDTAVSGGAIWQFVTYLLVNSPGIWAFLQIVLLGLFGREVEIRLGRAGFLRLYFALWLAAPLLYALLGFALPAPDLVGSSLPNFAIFIAFTILSPYAEVFFGIQARWVALALLALSSMQYFAEQNITGLLGLWGLCAITWALIRWERDLPAFSSSQPPAPKIPKPQKNPRPSTPAVDVHHDIDPILEKISRSGFASLSREERQRLDRARQSLLAKEGRKP